MGFAHGKGWGRLIDNMQELSAQHPWEQRDPRAVFRGSTHGRSCWNGTAGAIVDDGGYGGGATGSRGSACGRRLLRQLMLAPAHAPLFDAGYSFVFLDHQPRYRLTVYAEGHLGWADRARLQLLTGSVLLMQETMCREWYALALRPWVHYVPLEYWFGNLHAAARWAAAPQNSAAVRAIARNGRRFVDALLRPAAVRRYAIALLRGYGSALRYRVQRRAGAEAAASFLRRTKQDEEPTADTES